MAPSKLDISKTTTFIEQTFDNSVLPKLKEYIEIPNLSRSYDPEYLTNGLLEKAGHLIKDWIEAQNVNGLTVQMLQDQGRTPNLLVEITPTDPQCTENILMYGHFDKQPHMTGWEVGLGPITPVVRDNKLYGRGGADDGYAAFCAVLSVKTAQLQGLHHARIIILLESDEESGSYDLPYYLDKFADQIGIPDLIICLDSGALDYEHLWVTTSLRGVIMANLEVTVLNEGVHSGDASGVVPSSFRIIRQLLDRLENPLTGEMANEFNVNIPADRYEQLMNVIKLTQNTIIDKFPWKDQTQPTKSDPFQAMLNRCWKPTLSYVGIDGVPSTSNGGNVLRPYTTLKLSVRVPPTLCSKKASQVLKEILEKDPPYNATVKCHIKSQGSGWNAPSNKPYLTEILESASQNYFNGGAQYQGEGGSIPFMKMLGDRFPKSQFAILGILGPNSNAHGPNEFLHIPMCKKLMMCVSQIVVDSYGRLRE